jgi:crossover junction endodeoxyribonuclease RuvC
MIRRVLGFDPGSGVTAIAMLDVDERGAVIRADSLVVSGKKEPGHIPGLVFMRDLVSKEDPATTIIAVETPEGAIWGGGGRAANVLATGVLSGRIAGWAIGQGYTVETASAQEWRRGLGCLGTVAESADSAVSDMIRLRIPSWPSRSSNHARDAAGVALYVLERLKLRARGVVA